MPSRKSKKARIRVVIGGRPRLCDVGEEMCVPLNSCDMGRRTTEYEVVQVEVAMVIIAPRKACSIYVDPTNRYIKQSKAVKMFMKGV